MPDHEGPTSPPPTSPKTSPETSSTDSTSLEIREYIAAAIGAALVGVTLVLLVWTYQAAGVVNNFNAEAFGRQKDILLLALGFLGTVIGYYFGRLPAEQQANASRKQADAATNAAQKAKEDKHKAGQLISDAIKKVEQKSSNLEGGTPPNDALRTLREAERLLYST
jgi:hypothetical protein